MADSRVTFDIAPRALVKILAAIAIVWLWLNLWQLLMLIVVAVVLAVSLDPIVEVLCRRKVPRFVAAPLIVTLLAAIVVTFFLFAGSSLAGQAQTAWLASAGGRTRGTGSRSGGSAGRCRSQ